VRPDSWITLALFVLAFAYFSLTFRGTLDLHDEGYLLARSAQVAEGAVPHRDFQDVYGPAVFATSGAALALGDGQILAVRVLVALLKALAVAAGFAISRRLAPRWVAVFAAAIGIAYWGRFSANLNAPYAALFTIPIGLAATLCLIRAQERRSLVGLLVAGSLAGLGVLFKQSLGVMVAYGLLLSAIAVACGREDAAAAPIAAPRAASIVASRASRYVFACAWAVAAVAALVPMAGYLTLSDYALHFLPMHAVFVVVAVSVWPPRAAVLSQLLGKTIVPFVAGLLAAPLAAVVFHASSGGLDQLVYDMWLLPLSLEGYYVPTLLPPLAVLGFFAAAIAAVVAGLLVLAGRVRDAAWPLLAALALLSIGLFAPTEMPRLREPVVLLGRGPFALEGVLAPMLLCAALGLSWQRLASASARISRIPVLLVWSMLCFQVFPRAGHNLWILHGALAPLLALVIGDLLELTRAGSAGQSRTRKVAAACLVALLPIWLVVPIVRTVVAPDAVASTTRALALPRARGLSLDARQIDELSIRDLEETIAWLAVAEPGDAPLLVLGNDELLPLLANRPGVLDDHRYPVFLVGWGLWPGSALDQAAILARVEEHPEVLVVQRAGQAAQRLRGALPRVYEFIEINFRPVARFGGYRVLRRLPAPER
jgi:hypothetical protein